MATFHHGSGATHRTRLYIGGLIPSWHLDHMTWPHSIIMALWDQRTWLGGHIPSWLCGQRAQLRLSQFQGPKNTAKIAPVTVHGHLSVQGHTFSTEPKEPEPKSSPLEITLVSTNCCSSGLLLKAVAISPCLRGSSITI